jgi:flagellar biosynthesis/type III secretory pathway protein FliH
MAYDNRQKWIWDQTARENEAREAGRAEGVEEGIEKGIEQGIEKGLGRINWLNSMLVRDNRIEDLVRSTSDSEFQLQLLKEYHID